jgi:hypothetical protein
MNLGISRCFLLFYPQVKGFSWFMFSKFEVYCPWALVFFFFLGFELFISFSGSLIFPFEKWSALSCGNHIVWLLVGMIFIN